MELLTGKCRIEFEKWYREEFKNRNLPYFNGFVISDVSIKKGVLQEYFYSVDIIVQFNLRLNKNLINIWSVVCKNYSQGGKNNSIEEAIKKANELRNEQLK